MLKQSLLALLLSGLMVGCGESTSKTELETVSDSNDSALLYQSNSASEHDLVLRAMARTNEENSSNVVNVGHSVEIEYDIASAVEELNTTTIYFYAGAATYDGELDDNETYVETEGSEYFLGSKAFTTLPQGDSHYKTLLKLPNDIPTGEYRIFAFVDPMNLIEENNESNNFPSPDPEVDSIHVDINVSNLGSNASDIQLKSFELKQKSILIIAKEAVNLAFVKDAKKAKSFSPHAFDATIDIYHFSQNLDSNVTVKAQINIDDEWIDLDIWNNAVQNYQSEISLQIPHTTESFYTNLHISLPKTVLEALEGIFDTTDAVTYEMRAVISNELDAYENDNSVVDTVVLNKAPVPSGGTTTGDVKPKPKPEDAPPPPKQSASRETHAVQSDIDKGLSNSFEKAIGDKSYFYGSLELLAEAGVDTSNARVSTKATSQLDFSVFGIALSSPLLYSNAEMYVAPNDSSLGRITSVEFIGQTLYSDSQEVSDASITISKEFAKEQLLAQATFIVGPVPITVKASASGGVGAKLTFSWIDGVFSADGSPYANFNVIGTGGIDIALATAGIKATLTLLEDEFHATPSITPLFSTQNGIESVTGSFVVTNDINMLDGSFGIFAETKSVKTCKKCKKIKIFGKKKKYCVKYPCGFDTLSYDKTLFNINGFTQTQTLYSKSVDDLL